MKKYAIIGSHGVGKTSLCEKLWAKSTEMSESKCGVMGEVVRHCPFEINEHSSINGGHWIVTEQISRELGVLALKSRQERTDILLCDRSVIDPIMYLEAGNRFPKREFQTLREYAHSWMKTYDKVVFIKADRENQLKSDGFRSTDKEFQMLVDTEFCKYVEKYGKYYLNNMLTIESKDLFYDGGETLYNVYEYLFWSSKE
jgi:hypothetical protein